MTGPDHGIRQFRRASRLAAPLGWIYGAALAFRLFHHRRRPRGRTPANAGLTGRKIIVPLGGSRYIDAWLSPGDPRRVVVLGHGIGLGKWASFAHAEFLIEAGYTVCLFDHRGHGESSRNFAWTRMGDRYTDDISAVVGYLREIPEHHDACVTVFGFSFSTFASVYGLTRNDCSADAVICDSGPGADLKSILSAFLRSGTMPIPPLLDSPVARRNVEQAFVRCARSMLGTHWPPVVPAGNADIPVLVIASGRDEIIPVAQIQQLIAHLPNVRQATIDAAGHLAGWKTDAPAYRALVLDFLTQCRYRGAAGPARIPDPAVETCHIEQGADGGR